MRQVTCKSELLQILMFILLVVGSTIVYLFAVPVALWRHFKLSEPLDLNFVNLAHEATKTGTTFWSLK